jgi:hypothetical protein
MNLRKFLTTRSLTPELPDRWGLPALTILFSDWMNAKEICAFMRLIRSCLCLCLLKCLLLACAYRDGAVYRKERRIFSPDCCIPCCNPCPWRFCTEIPRGRTDSRERGGTKRRGSRPDEEVLHVIGPPNWFQLRLVFACISCDLRNVYCTLISAQENVDEHYLEEHCPTVLLLMNNRYCSTNSKEFSRLSGWDDLIASAWEFSEVWYTRIDLIQHGFSQLIHITSHISAFYEVDLPPSNPHLVSSRDTPHFFYIFVLGYILDIAICFYPIKISL